MTDHIRFTVAESNAGWAIFHQAPPTEHGDGKRSLSLKFPALIASEYLNEPAEMLAGIAQILNQHWNEE